MRDSLVALDTNQFLFAVRGDEKYPYCRTLIFDRIQELNLFVPTEVQIEVRRNLSDAEVRGVMEALRRARSVIFDFEAASREEITVWESRGAKKGDAVIAARLQRTGVGYFVSENRHFLREIGGIPFTVLTSEEAVRLLNPTP